MGAHKNLFLILSLVLVSTVGLMWNMRAEPKQSPADVQPVMATTSSSALEDRLRALEEKNATLENKLSQQTQATKPVEQKTTITTTAPSKKLTNAEIIKKTKPAVVYIRTSTGAGSGMIIESSGTILTNAHVVFGVDEAEIKLTDGRILLATVMGRDEALDVALLKVQGDNLPTVELGDSSLVQQGDEVFTLGYPFGLEGDVSFKEGTISRTFIDAEGTYFETSAEIHPGNSGGAMVNDRGIVVGINTATFGITADGVQLGETIKFAIPINLAKAKFATLRGGSESLKWASSRAFGVVTLYNESDAPQRLIKSTRLESPDGKIFRMTWASITIPAKTNGVAGSFEVTVFAEETGASYNIPPSTFKIPGLKGGAEYDLIYGKTTQPMKGGS